MNLSWDRYVGNSLLKGMGYNGIENLKNSK